MSERKKLKISCGTVDCENGLHCYRQTKREAERAVREQEVVPTARSRTGLKGGGSGVSVSGASAGPTRVCKACGLALVNWDRVHRRDIQDVVHTFKSLKTEWIRHHFWHRGVDALAIDYAFKKGRIQLRERLKTQITGAIGRSAKDLWRDGAQTPLGRQPKAENILYFAQHATASCCRKCAEEWHNIPRDRPLSKEEIEYLTDLGARYIDERLPGLEDGPSRRPVNLAADSVSSDDSEGDPVPTAGPSDSRPQHTYKNVPKRDARRERTST